MSVLKPNYLYDWVPDNTNPAKVVPPTVSKQITGWATNEKPPQQTFNHKWQKDSEWFQYLNGMPDYNYTPFNNTGVIIGWGESAGDNQGGSVEDATFLGFGAGANNTGNHVIAVGSTAALDNTGSWVTSIGIDSGQNNTGSTSVFIGREAGKNNSDNSVIGIGSSAAKENSGNSCVFVGLGAGNSNTGDFASAFGHGAASENTGANCSFLGFNAGLANKGANTVAIGTQAGWGNAGDACVLIAGGVNNAGDNVFASGQSCLTNNTGSDCTAIGSSAGLDNTNDNLIAIGPNAALTNVSFNVIALGSSALSGAFLATDCFGAGSLALSGSNGVDNVAIGPGSLNASSGSSNIGLGREAGLLTTGSKSIFMGEGSGNSTTGNSNIGLGFESLNFATGGINVAIGDQSGKSSESTQSVFIGTAAGANLKSTGAKGDEIIAIGDLAANHNSVNTHTIPNKSIFIGNRVGFDFDDAVGDARFQLGTSESNLLFDAEMGATMTLDTPAYLGFDGETGFKTFHVAIGTWNMDANATVTIAIPSYIDKTKIVDISIGAIIDDDDVRYGESLDGDDSIRVSALNATDDFLLSRPAGSGWDTASFDGAGNRGYIKVSVIA